MKKGIFFTIDSILAVGIIFTVILLTSSLYAEKQPIVHLNYLSKDLINTLSIATVEDIDNEYLNERIDNGDIDNVDNTVLEQIIEFWMDNELEYANKTASNVTEPWVPATTGIGIWIDNEIIYSRGAKIEKSLVSSKKIISGTGKIDISSPRNNMPRLLGPVVVEVRVWQ